MNKSKIILFSLPVIIFLSSFLPSSSCPFASEVVVIKSRNIKPYDLCIKGFKRVVDTDIREYNIEGSLEKGTSVIETVKSGNPDLTVGLGAEAAYIAANSIKETPVLFSMLSSPERYNISGKNITGVKLDIALMRQLQIYKQVMPDIKKIGVMFSSDRVKKITDRARAILRKMDIELIAEHVSSPKDIPPVINRLLKKTDSIWLLFDPVVTGSPRIIQKIIILQSLRNKKPVIGFNKWSVTAGALFALTTDYEDIGRQVGEIALRLLENTKPSSIPVESPQKIKIFFNDKVIERVNAKMNLNIPDNAFIWEAR